MPGEIYEAEISLMRGFAAWLLQFSDRIKDFRLLRILAIASFVWDHVDRGEPWPKRT